MADINTTGSFMRLLAEISSFTSLHVNGHARFPYSSVYGFVSTCHEYNNSLKALTKSSPVRLWILTDKAEMLDDAESTRSQCLLNPDMKSYEEQLLFYVHELANFKTHQLNLTLAYGTLLLSSAYLKVICLFLCSNRTFMTLKRCTQ